MKIAFVKQEVYQDLYVTSNGHEPKEILFSSSERVGPLGLFTLFDADFYIVKEEEAPECQIWKQIIPHMGEQYKSLKMTTIDKIPGQEFHRPGSDKPPGHYAVECSSISWGDYDVVISINCSVPTAIVQKFPHVLWTYMIGEANKFVDKVYFGYDASLNQLNRGVLPINGIVDFPYTFVGPHCLEDIMSEHLGREPERWGVYAEVNTTTERPVRAVPHFEPITSATGHPIRIHSQHIQENLQELYDAKYYIKVGGRITRGNGAIEAISSGTLVMMRPEDLILTQLLPKETWVESIDDAIEMIHWLDANPPEYDRLLKQQRDIVQQFVVDYPMRSLELLLEKKKKSPTPNRVRMLSRKRRFLVKLFKKLEAFLVP